MVHLGSRGALLIDDYSDRKGYKGIIRTPIDSVNKLALRLAGTKFQMNTHAIGDKANRIVLNAYRDALFDFRDPRWRIEHAQVIAKEDFELFKLKLFLLFNLLMQLVICIGLMIELVQIIELNMHMHIKNFLDKSKLLPLEQTFLLKI